jgi:aspartate 1-decarboxylase
MNDDEVSSLQPKIVFVDEFNQITRIETHDLSIPEL